MKKTKLLLGLLIITAPLFLAGCYVPFLNKEITIPFLEKKPQTAWDLMVKKMMVKKMEKTRSYRREDKIKVLVDIDLPSQVAAAEGMSIIQGKSQAIIDLDINSAFDKDKIESQMNMDASLKKKTGFSLHLINSLVKFKEEKQEKQRNFYLQVAKIGGIVPLPSAQKILGKWYKVIDKINQTKQKNKDKKEKVSFGQLLNILQKDHAFQITKRFRDQKIDGHNCYHLQVVVNRNNLRKGFEDIFIFWNTFFQKNGKKISAQEKKETLKEIDKLAQVLSGFHGEVWIDKDNFYLRKYNFNLSLKGKELVSLAPFLDSFQYVPQLKVTLDGHLNGFGQSQNITLPTKAITIKSFVTVSEAIFGNGNEKDSETSNSVSSSPPEESFSSPEEKPSSAPEKQSNQLSQNYSSSQKTSSTFSNNPKTKSLTVSLTAKERVKKQILEEDSDNDGLPTLQEIKISSDPYAKDTDGDGYSDGQELAAGFNLWGAGSLKDPQEVPFNILASKNFSARQAFYIFNHYLVFGPSNLAVVFMPKNGTVYKGENYNLNGLLSIWQKNGWKYWIKSDSPSALDYCIDRPNVDVECYLVMQPVVWQKGDLFKSGPPISFYWRQLNGQAWKLISIKLSK